MSKFKLEELIIQTSKSASWDLKKVLDYAHEELNISRVQQPGNELEYDFIQDKQGRIYSISPDDIVCNSLKEMLDENGLEEDKEKKISLSEIQSNNLYKTLTREISGKVFNLLPITKIIPFRDNKKSAHVFFEDVIVKIHKDGTIQYIKYGSDEFPHKFYATRILKRNSPTGLDKKKLTDPFDRDDLGSINKLMKFLSGSAHLEDKIIVRENYRTLLRALGRLAWRYKDSGKAKAVVLCDGHSKFDAHGGNCKNVCIKWVASVHGEEDEGVVQIDGQLQNNQFQLSEVKTNTAVIHYSDFKQGGSLKPLFNQITNGTHSERKGKDKYTIPFKYSPTVALSTNYPLDDVGGSSRRRLVYIVIFPHFSHSYDTSREFGDERFWEDSWTEEQWAKSDELMFNAIHIAMNEELQDTRNEDFQDKQMWYAVSGKAKDAEVGKRILEFMDEFEMDYNSTDKIMSTKRTVLLAEFKERTELDWGMSDIIKSYKSAEDATGLVYNKDRSRTGTDSRATVVFDIIDKKNEKEIPEEIQATMSFEAEERRGKEIPSSNPSDILDRDKYPGERKTDIMDLDWEK